MTILAGRLFAIPDEPRKWLSIIAWWELRRIAYNAIMLVIGIFGLLIFGLFTDLYEHTHPDERYYWSPLLSVMGAALGANVCYTTGWICELVARALWRDRVRCFGPVMLRLGLLFSCVVCILPCFVIAVALVINAVKL